MARMPILLMLAVLAGCASLSSSAPPVTLPTAPRAERITVVPRNCGERKDRWITITDRSKIDRFVAFVNERQDGWTRPWDTFPTPEYTVSLESGGTTIGFVWLSSSWIGGPRQGRRGLGEPAAGTHSR